MLSAAGVALILVDSKVGACPAADADEDKLSMKINLAFIAVVTICSFITTWLSGGKDLTVEERARYF